jgi:16S rRNA (adenine1518-N6/adenine1519-N6)-dimethyltransferase
MSNYYNTGDILRAYDIKPTKSLGQNFLNDLNVVRNIVDCGELSKDEAVIEVGPGLGVMTSMLSEEAGLVVAVEIDQHLMPVLEPLALSRGNIKIINKDILSLDINRDIIEAIIKPAGFTKVKVVANLPYYITTPIAMKFLEENVQGLTDLVFMVQKEVADRMTAGPGGKEYGALSVAVGYFAEGKTAFKVPPSAFSPRPSVDSAVVSLKVRTEPPFELSDKAYFFKVVKAAFGQRRKTLANALSNAPYIGVSRERVYEILEKMGKDSMIRGETLKPEEFGLLSNLLYEIKTSK